MQLPQLFRVEWLEMAALAALGVMALAMCFPLLGGDAPLPVEAANARMPRVERRACRAFADAVTRGDLDAAERAAEDAFELGRGEHHRLGSERRRGRHRGRVIEWDERKLFARSIDDVRRQFRDPAASAFWFSGLERVPRGDRVDILLGPREPIRIELFSETWNPRLDAVSFAAGSDTFEIDGNLSLRTVVAGTGPTGELDTAVEVWVHMETVDTDDARRALVRARGIVRDGLGRMAAELNPT